MTLNIQAVNDAPIANDDSFSVTEDGRLNVVAPGVMSNDSDVEGDPVTVRLISGPVHGRFRSKQTVPLAMFLSQITTEAIDLRTLAPTA